jgi:hypothetical protein
MSRSRKGKKQYLKDSLTHCIIRELERHFELKGKIHLIRSGKRQGIETLINEEAFFLAKYLRSETQN